MVVVAIVLFLNAAFNVVTWPRFYARVVKDPRSRDEQGKPTKFLIVHAVIFIIALVLAVLSALVGIFALTGTWG